jgi:translation initiation factor IF-2
MAKLHEEVLVIKVSKLVKDSETAGAILNADTVASLEAVVQELAGANTLVEIQVA